MSRPNLKPSAESAKETSKAVGTWTLHKSSRASSLTSTPSIREKRSKTAALQVNG